MSPEQTQGKKLDHRSDICSFGCLMYEMLTGKAPFDCDNYIATMYKRLEEEPPPFPTYLNIPEWYEEIVMRTLAIHANDRYSSATDLAEDLADALNCTYTSRPVLRTVAPKRMTRPTPNLPPQPKSEPGKPKKPEQKRVPPTEKASAPQPEPPPHKERKQYWSSLIAFLSKRPSDRQVIGFIWIITALAVWAEWKIAETDAQHRWAGTFNRTQFNSDPSPQQPSPDTHAQSSWLPRFGPWRKQGGATKSSNAQTNDKEGASQHCPRRVRSA